MTMKFSLAFLCFPFVVLATMVPAFVCADVDGGPKMLRQGLKVKYKFLHDATSSTTIKLEGKNVKTKRLLAGGGSPAATAPVASSPSAAAPVAASPSSPAPVASAPAPVAPLQLPLSQLLMLLSLDFHLSLLRWHQLLLLHLQLPLLLLLLLQLILTLATSAG